ncbi:adenosine deaminase [Streptomyces sp. NBC_00988]|uniref:adenosine deaminase family protein n=1 Tax=Streptomyces sp. NBC_00988 TaxID=2903704 RepID=UPI003869BD89|nr:adenosine deaminase [Streptomyces sp. NBC_00988]
MSELRLPAPSAELHLLLEGALEPETVFELSRRNATRLPYTDFTDLAGRHWFTGLQFFLDLYYANMTAALHSRRDVVEMTWRYLVRAHAAGCRHVEVFVDAHEHGTRDPGGDRPAGRTTRRAADEPDVSGCAIVCAMRDRPAAESLRMLDAGLAPDIPILDLGSDSAEVGHPSADFTEGSDVGVRAGLRRVCHAGEEGPPDYIRQAPDILGAERVDRAVRCLEDPDLVARLGSERVPLTVYSPSDVRLRVVEGMSEHSLWRMLRQRCRDPRQLRRPRVLRRLRRPQLPCCCPASGVAPGRTAHSIRKLHRGVVRLTGPPAAPARPVCGLNGCRCGGRGSSAGSARTSGAHRVGALP